MKLTKLISVLLILALCVSGCGTKTPENTPAPAETTAATEAPAQTEADPQAETEAMMAAYRNVLEDLSQNQIWPDGTACEYDAEFGDIEENTFAISDVTGDGAEDLIISYSTAPMAGMSAAVYEFDADSGKVREVLREFPALTVYDGGLIRADWAHNQGLSENFWPYTLYYYNEEAGAYTLLATVDAWEKGFRARDYEGNEFPADVDTDGTGIVYFINYGGRRDTVSQSDYEAWEAETFAGCSAIFFNWMNLTEENIRSVAQGSVG